MRSEIIRVKCDFCSEVMEYGKGESNPNKVKEITSWITLKRDFLVEVGPEPQIYEHVLHACKDSCAANLISTSAMSLPEHIADAQRKFLESRKQVKIPARGSDNA